MRQWMITSMICLAGCVGGMTIRARAESPIAPPANVLNGNSNVDDVLDALQQDAKVVHAFSADVRDTEDDLIQSTEVIRTGKVWFVFKPSGDATLHLVLDHKQSGNQQFAEKIEYLLDNGWLSMRNYDTKKETHMQLVRPGEKVDLFQLGKGPFPLPIGQDKSNVHGQFDVTIVSPDKDDPPGTIHLKLVPKPGTPLDQQFSSFEVWVDRSTKMPVRLVTVNKHETESKTWDLLNLKVNPQLSARDLTLPQLEKGWDSIDKPLPQ